MEILKGVVIPLVVAVIAVMPGVLLHMRERSGVKRLSDLADVYHRLEEGSVARESISRMMERLTLRLEVQESSANLRLVYYASFSTSVVLFVSFFITLFFETLFLSKPWNSISCLLIISALVSGAVAITFGIIGYCRGRKVAEMQPKSI